METNQSWINLIIRINTYERLQICKSFFISIYKFRYYLQNMHHFLPNQLIFDSYSSMNYWNTYQNLQNSYYNNNYYAYQQMACAQPQPYPYYHQKFSQNLEQAFYYEDPISTQCTRRSIIEHQDVIQQVTNETLERYIMMIINEDESFHNIITKLKNNNQIALCNLLEMLAQKQKCQQKSREELVKYCLRKALKFIFQRVQEKYDKSKTNLKSAQKIFMQIVEKETQISIMLPFRKNSKNKTMNSDFLKQIFSSKTFVIYYKEFLCCLEQEIQKDSKKKIASLCNKIMNHIRDEKNFEFDVKRLPWSYSNVEKVKQAAQEMLLYSNFEIK
ncbi:unnamed protein product [Paramecium sonneborni]|uniref:Uncharacterized protein n=1 Tax=Paramecium sonneborni TaxID=65129 RepID=A0A8S1QU04_9CILI|nr:unnamed protein product [Paramecium sonneborni]